MNAMFIIFFQMGFAAGYGMAMICWVQVFYVCEFGESIEVCNTQTVLTNHTLLDLQRLRERWMYTMCIHASLA